MLCCWSHYTILCLFTFQVDSIQTFRKMRFFPKMSVKVFLSRTVTPSTRQIISPIAPVKSKKPSGLSATGCKKSSVPFLLLLRWFIGGAEACLGTIDIGPITASRAGPPPWLNPRPMARWIFHFRTTTYRVPALDWYSLRESSPASKAFATTATRAS